MKGQNNMQKLPPIHPGEVLLEDFMKPLGLSKYRVAKDIGVPALRISQIVRGQRSITADTALRLSSYFGNSATFWLGLQNDYDIEEEKRTNEQIFKRIQLTRLTRNKTHHNIA